MNVPYPVAQGSIRFSVGRYNTEEDVETTLKVLPGIIGKLVEMSPYQEELAAIKPGAPAERNVYSTGS
jgi:cysteine desulfurase